MMRRLNNRKVRFASLICLFLYFVPQNIFSDNIEKANKYYEKYDYKFAIAIYEKVMLTKPNLEVAQKLANCYRFINDTEAAEKAYARVFSFQDFAPVNYKYYADALKQNGKFDAAKRNYLLYAEKIPSKSFDAVKLANSCDAARIWIENPDSNVHVQNELALNSKQSEFSPVVYNNGYVFVSDRLFVQDAKPGKDKQVYGWTGNPYLKMYEADVQNPSAPRISLMPKPLNNEYHNGPAVFTADENGIYFTRTQIPQTEKKNKITVGKNALYFARKENGKWTVPQLLPFNLKGDFSVQHPALSPDGTILYFASDMPGGFGRMDIYASRKQTDRTWAKPQNCGANINTTEDDVFPTIRKNGQFYFSSKGHVGMGGLDIFTAKGSYAEFSEPENLKSPINSTKDDFGMLFLNDNTGFISSNRNGGLGLDDIYRFTIIPVKPEEPYFAVEGKVIEQSTGLALPDIQIFLVNKTTGEETTTTSDLQGKFHFELQEGMDYVVRGDIEQYFSRQEGQISTKNLNEPTVFNVQFELQRSQDAYLVRLKNIYYNFDKWNIRADARPELNRIIAFMDAMPNVNIQLRSHTDSRGPAVYNTWLSQKRAESAVGYLQKGGVEKARLTALGLGETELVNRCADGVKCSAAEHQLNRRTEFKVVKVNPVLSAVSGPMAVRNSTLQGF